MSTHSTATPVQYKSLAFLGYPGYRVGTDGSVWSRRRGGSWSSWKQLKPICVAKGRKEVGIYNEDSKLRRFSIHRLVLSAFVGPCPDGMECCHNDGDPTNNRLDNLRWDTHENNEKDKLQHGTLKKGSQVGNSKLTEAEVSEIRRLRKEGWGCPALARKYKVSAQMICMIVKRQWWKHVD